MELDRRALIGGAGALAVGPGLAKASAEEVVDLWPGTPPGGGGPLSDPGGESRGRPDSRGMIVDIAHPSFSVYRPDRPNGTGVLIVAGGGYAHINQSGEALPLARWLTTRGTVAFVLSYRLPVEGWGAKAQAPLQDAQRALRLIRSLARRYALDPAKLGMVGFSAGGHLAALTSVSFETSSYSSIDHYDNLLPRPDFTALIYPVISLRPPLDQTSTRRVLIGEHPPQAATDMYSVEQHVRPSTPPTFLVHAADDTLATVDHSLLMFAALRAVKVPTEMHIVESGGHGFGMGVTETTSAAWPGLFNAWGRGHGVF